MSFGVERQEALDIGGRDINGTVHDLFQQRPYVVDIEDGRGVDLVADCSIWEPPREWDVALCSEVFEHTPTWPDIIRTAKKALRPGGLFITTMASTNRPPHGAATDSVLEGEYYQNVDEDALRSELSSWTMHYTRMADKDMDLYAWAIK